MKRLNVILGLALALAMILAISVAPALANDNDRHNNHHNRFFNDDDLRFVFFDDDDFRHNRFFDDDFFDDDLDQDADSGDIDQSFDITGGGDNSNQCVGLQSAGNTGNAQNQLGFSTFGDGFNNDFDRDHGDRFFRDFDRFDDFNDDLEIEDSDASNEVSPTNTTTCDQQVNQAASASG
jgi:hypothetical protein